MRKCRNIRSSCGRAGGEGRGVPRSPSVTASRHRLPPRQWQCCGHGATLQATVYTAVQYSLSDYGKILIDQDLSCQLWKFLQRR